MNELSARYWQYYYLGIEYHPIKVFQETTTKKTTKIPHKETSGDLNKQINIKC